MESGRLDIGSIGRDHISFLSIISWLGVFTNVGVSVVLEGS